MLGMQFRIRGQFRIGGYNFGLGDNFGLEIADWALLSQIAVLNPKSKIRNPKSS
jgi:hypothetical protein